MDSLFDGPTCWVHGHSYMMKNRGEWVCYSCEDDDFTDEELDREED